MALNEYFSLLRSFPPPNIFPLCLLIYTGRGVDAMQYRWEKVIFRETVCFISHVRALRCRLEPIRLGSAARSAACVLHSMRASQPAQCTRQILRRGSPPSAVFTPIRGDEEHGEALSSRVRRASSGLLFRTLMQMGTGRASAVLILLRNGA